MGIKSSLTRKIKIPFDNEITRYQLMFTLLLSLVPLFCGGLLVILLSIFTKLNLFFLEAQGLILHLEIRDAYFREVEQEILGVLGYLLMQVVITAVASFVVMRWATAPFSNAEKMILTAAQKPSELKPQSRWMSESPAFDRLIWLFSLRIKSGAPHQPPGTIHMYGTNLPFLLKFLFTFLTLSFSTGFVLSIIVDSVYRRVVDLALQLIRTTGPVNHYFLAQQEMIQEGANVAIMLSVVCYFFLGLQISRYMASMLYVFSRALADDAFPLTLRSTDLYHSLAQKLNEARSRLS